MIESLSIAVHAFVSRVSKKKQKKNGVYCHRIINPNNRVGWEELSTHWVLNTAYFIHYRLNSYRLIEDIFQLF